MNEFLPAVIAVAGTLLGGVLAFFAQYRLSANQIAEGRLDRRRDDFVDAASALAAALTKLLQGEYNRAKVKIQIQVGDAHVDSKPVTYDRRSDVQLAQFRLQIICSPTEDQSLVQSAERVAQICKDVSDDLTTFEDLTERHRAAKGALRDLISQANERADALYSRSARRGIGRA